MRRNFGLACDRIFVLFFLILWEEITSQQVGDIPLPGIRLDQYPPSIKITSSLKPYYISGNDASIGCEASGVPEPNLVWMRDGIELNITEEENNVDDNQFFFKSTGSDCTLRWKKPNSLQTRFQCIARNEFGIASSQFVVILKASESYDVDPFPEEEADRSYIPEGAGTTLDCNPPASFPSDLRYNKVTWYRRKKDGKDESVVKYSNRTVMDMHYSLHFSNLEADDYNYKYYCVYENTALATSSTGRTWSFLPVSLPESQYCSNRRHYKIDLFYVHPLEEGQTMNDVRESFHTKVTMVKGTPLVLQCVFRSSPTYDLVWLRGQDVISNNEFSSEEQHRTMLRFDEPSEDLIGTYNCTGSMNESLCTKRPIPHQQSHSFEVSWNEPPSWTEVPEPLTVAEGEDAVIRCSARAIPPPTTAWFLNSEELQPAALPRRVEVSDKELVIRATKPNDTAVVQCNTSNVHGYLFSTLYLRVISSPPKLRNKLDEKNHVVEGSSRELLCNFSGGPKPKTTWTKDGQVVTDGDNISLSPNKLILKNVAMSTSGNYSCTASNKYGKRTIQGELIVYAHNNIESVEPQSGLFPLSEQTRLKCNAKSDHRLKQNLTITWLRNGKHVNNSDAYDISTPGVLLIKKVVSGQSGNFTCQAATDVEGDKSNQTISLVFKDPPAVEILNVTKVGSDFVLIEVNSPYGFEDMKHQSVYREKGDAEWTEGPYVNYTDSQSSVMNISGLLPNTVYEVGVYNVYQADTKKTNITTINVQTIAITKKPEPVHGLTVKSFGPTFIELTWKLADDGFSGVAHRVIYKEKGAKNWEYGPKTNESSANVTDLAEATDYEIGVYSIVWMSNKRSKITTISAATSKPLVSETEVSSAMPLWLVILIILLILLVVVLIVLLVFCCLKRRRRNSYHPAEKEKLPVDEEKPEPVEEAIEPNSDTPLQNSAPNPPPSTTEPYFESTDSLADLDDPDLLKFSEDGSFIGQYGVLPPTTNNSK